MDIPNICAGIMYILSLLNLGFEYYVSLPFWQFFLEDVISFWNHTNFQGLFNALLEEPTCYPCDQEERERAQQDRSAAVLILCLIGNKKVGVGGRAMRFHWSIHQPWPKALQLWFLLHWNKQRSCRVISQTQQLLNWSRLETVVALGIFMEMYESEDVCFDTLWK